MEPKYTFLHLEKKEYNCFSNKDIQELLMKWSMKGNLKVQTYCFNESFQVYQKHDFVDAFFRSEVVKSTIQGLAGTTVAGIEIEQIPCSILSMSFFDRLTDPSNGIVRSDEGWLVKCLDEQIDDFVVADELRRMLLDRESENYGLFSDADRKQFIFRLFQHLCIGGQWCQYEDTIRPYLDTAKTMYKNLISVQKDSCTKELFICSAVLRVVVQGSDGKPCLPFEPDNLQNFAYLIVNPLSRQITVLTHQYGGTFFC